MELIANANASAQIWDFIAQNAEIFTSGVNQWGWEFEAYFYGENAKTDLANALRTIRRTFKADVEKDYEGNQFQAVIKDLKSNGHQIPSWFKFNLRTDRSNVCAKVVTGTETIEVPDYSKAPTKEVTRDVIEWQCDPIIDAI